MDLISLLLAHPATTIFVASYLVVGGVNTMPKPGDPFKLYQWLYDWSHVLLNSPAAKQFEQQTVVKYLPSLTGTGDRDGTGR
jgi:hypothetical protein